MRRILSLLLALLFLPCAVNAEGAELSVSPLQEEIRPWKAVLLTFSVPEEGTADLDLADADGNTVIVAVEGLQVRAGVNQVWWNGTHETVPAPRGSWLLRLRHAGRETAVPVTVGEPVPYLVVTHVTGIEVRPDTPVTVSFYASEDGVLSCSLEPRSGDRILLPDQHVSQGENTYTVTGSGLKADTDIFFHMNLTDSEGNTSQDIEFIMGFSGFERGGEAQPAEETVSGEDQNVTVEEETAGETEDSAEEGEDAANEPEEAAEDPEDASDEPEETADGREDAADEPEEIAEPAGDDEEALPSGEEEPVEQTADIEDEQPLPQEEEQSEEEEQFSHVTGAGEGPVIIEEEIMLPEDEEEEPIPEIRAPSVSRESGNFFMACAGEDQAVFTPSYSSPYAGKDETENYWTTPMNIADENTIWQILMQPITVVDNGKKKAERMQVPLRAEPDENSAAVGLVTCITQGVHVLEVGETWSLIECYSSSFYATTVEAWNLLVQGWVPTKYLKTVNPNSKFGIVVDKLLQRLYIFRDGKLYDTLLVSTGLTNAKQPFNETRAGEFLLQDPAVGEFRSDNIYCSMGIRFNDGDLIHEVPHLKLADGGKTYKTTEYKLGTKASHGCIRVQRRTTPKGTNMQWIWNNRVNNIKILIWEDWQGRQVSYPSNDTVLYYNPRKGSMYHSCETCRSAVGKTFTPFTYGELDEEPFSKLERCEWCSPPLRRAEIDKINETYAAGGDHDPVLTKARQKYFDALK